MDLAASSSTRCRISLVSAVGNLRSMRMPPLGRMGPSHASCDGRGPGRGARAVAAARGGRAGEGRRELAAPSYTPPHTP